jgi:hypothetical protein
MGCCAVAAMSDQKPPRSFSDFSTEFLLGLPSEAEIRSFSDRDLALVGNLSNLLDNMRYLERKRRDEAPKS